MKYAKFDTFFIRYDLLIDSIASLHILEHFFHLDLDLASGLPVYLRPISSKRISIIEVRDEDMVCVWSEKVHGELEAVWFSAMFLLPSNGTGPRTPCTCIHCDK